MGGTACHDAVPPVGFSENSLFIHKKFTIYGDMYDIMVSVISYVPRFDVDRSLRRSYFAKLLISTESCTAVHLRRLHDNSERKLFMSKFSFERLIAMLLCVLMVLSCVPCLIAAEDGEGAADVTDTAVGTMPDERFIEADTLSDGASYLIVSEGYALVRNGSQVTEMQIAIDADGKADISDAALEDMLWTVTDYDAE